MAFLTSRDQFDFRPMGGGLVKLQGDLIYQDKKCGTIIVPDGFECDLASYPHLARPFFDRLGTSMRPAVLHDHLYRNRVCYISRSGDIKPVDKFNADRILRQALKQEGANWFSRWATWAGVAVGGWYAWLT